MNTHPKENFIGTWEQISNDEHYWKIIGILEKIAKKHGNCLSLFC